MQRDAVGSYTTSIAGRETVRAFVPTPLPPIPPLDLSGVRQTLLERATLALGRLDSITLLLPDPQLFLYAYVRREAVLSSQIEGTQSSLSDLLLFELDKAPGEFRRSQNWIGGTRPGNARFVPPPPQEVEPGMAALESYIHGDNSPTPVLLKAALAHALCGLRQLCRDTGMTFPTAAKAMQTLVSLGITRELTGQHRNRVFVYDAYLNILNEGGEAL
ncbi:MAG: Fic family protein [Sulfuricella sp.]|nr:Fic family protein [Sulfuricella sp.]